MGSVFSGLFGGSAPSIDVEEPTVAPASEQAAEPASEAVRNAEQKRLRARRAFAGTLLTGSGAAASGKNSSTSLL